MSQPLSVTAWWGRRPSSRFPSTGRRGPHCQSAGAFRSPSLTGKQRVNSSTPESRETARSRPPAGRWLLGSGHAVFLLGPAFTPRESPGPRLTAGLYVWVPAVRRDALYRRSPVRSCTQATALQGQAPHCVHSASLRKLRQGWGSWSLLPLNSQPTWEATRSPKETPYNQAPAQE